MCRTAPQITKTWYFRAIYLSNSTEDLFNCRPLAFFGLLVAHSEPVKEKWRFTMKENMIRENFTGQCFCLQILYVSLMRHKTKLHLVRNAYSLKVQLKNAFMISKNSFSINEKMLWSNAFLRSKSAYSVDVCWQYLLEISDKVTNDKNIKCF